MVINKNDLNAMGQAAKNAAYSLALLSTDQKNIVLRQMADDLVAATPTIIAANQEDLLGNLVAAKFVDRLRLTPERIADMAQGLRDVAALADPTAKIDRGWVNDAGLQILQKRVPLGVVGMIFEARPNVTVDASGLCFKSGNAVILRGGKEAMHSNIALVTVLRATLKTAGLPVAAIQLITDPSHELAAQFMHLTAYLDVLIPRGGAGLINAVVQQATVPVIETGAGNCHIYVDAHAELPMAIDITVNAKVQRPSVCNAAEKLLVHKDVAAEFVPALVTALRAHGVEVRGDDRVAALVPDVVAATAADWDTEYNDLIMAVKIVDSEDDAIAHINAHNTKHSETIVTNSIAAGQRFQQRVDAACVYVNASTRFTDGMEFGFGARSELAPRSCTRADQWA